MWRIRLQRLSKQDFSLLSSLSKLHRKCKCPQENVVKRKGKEFPDVEGIVCNSREFKNFRILLRTSWDIWARRAVGVRWRRQTSINRRLTTNTTKVATPKRMPTMAVVDKLFLFDARASATMSIHQQGETLLPLAVSCRDIWLWFIHLQETNQGLRRAEASST